MMLRADMLPLEVELSYKALDSKHSFILIESKENIFVWNGKSCGRVERARALDIAQHVRDEDFSGRPAIRIIGKPSSPPNTQGF